jgi:DNA polymerase alpha-associated DNA helicase A
MFSIGEFIHCVPLSPHKTGYSRMHAQICEFPSKTLYSSKLKPHVSVETHLLRDLPETKVESEYEEKDLLGTPVIFFDTAGCDYFERLEGDGDEGSRCNENEAVVVKGWIEQLVRILA